MSEDVYFIGAIILWLPAWISIFYLGFYANNPEGIQDAGGLCLAILCSGFGAMIVAFIWVGVIPILILYGIYVKVFPYFKYLRDRH